MTGKLHKEKFNNFFYSPNTVRKTESRKIRWLWKENKVDLIELG